ncbi:unnamed protein product [Didymodactylos carnosus]|uniref:Palmitoyltransferase n=1 Tax=Didymodactylos carnosus TaxID=1234261 RepID=A0A813RQC3_9BILA|nr:unnamed protein product [Didymodactylos carnosus]CAF0800862.1 unnamed protein product [Didymodactylos carnosus]CAF3567950.1 unnamed protein product [Didymodactylos carnosus]CAF3584116.1 unnamed protein product [Didymodactylos carnosus]
MVIPLLPENVWGSLNAVLFTIVVSLSLISHARASYFDPGLVPLMDKTVDFSDLSAKTENTQQSMNEGWTLCNRCEIYRPPRSHHCRICKRCVRRLDHHCPCIHSIIVMIESILFGIFVVSVLIDQLQAILNDRSLIDSLKSNENSKIQPVPPSCVLLRKTFGRGPPVLWFFPCDLKKISHTTESVDMYHV